jgi:hypothetical protein
MTPEMESVLLGMFLALYCGLTADGARATRECLAAFAGDPEAYPGEAGILSLCSRTNGTRDSR